MKLKSEDIWFSRCIRQRALWTCEARVSKSCIPVFTGPDKGIQCSHFETRSKLSTRWHPINACCQCAACHAVFTASPLLFGQWIEAYLGKKTADWLVLTSNTPVKFTPKDRKDISGYYRKTFNEMQSKTPRNGRIDFEPAPIIEAKLMGAAA